ncbi:cation-translocating P-type ATPase [Lutimonas zeaxanthinifaciens]|uniref:cation-translocating P-type ATPase n=1 Tax=Lutimonas zeaxanthinifaciens TaxID=3060215 RepID=UPI00265D3A82|nr:cation-transporting P-type ATPase [Lutimonas sp. YSD2104]WKK64907.1 cation-transporting P-type ATPase [Lutimonas sp. YSD2104]
MIKNAYSFSAEDIAERLHTDLKKGLDLSAVKKHFAHYGPNEIPQDQPKSRFKILIDQLLNPIIYILAAATVLAFLFSDWLEGVAILIVIFISVAIGFFMEFQAVRSLEALRKLGQSMTYVLRAGKIQKIMAPELVPGDIIILQAGDVVTADARIYSQENLTLKESALTGESTPISKNTEILDPNTPVTNQFNMLFKGTMVTTGCGKAVVTATGANTQLGKIQQMGIEARKEITPLEKKLNEFGKWLIWLTLIFAMLIIIAGYVRGQDLILMIETGVALAVAAIPEGLPIVATIALAQGMLRLSKRKVIIKKLEAIETLGATNIICTDKTGTLTEDKMKVHSVFYEDTEINDIQHKSKPELDSVKSNKAFHEILRTSILCNNTSSVEDKLIGDSIEVALIEFAKKTEYEVNLIRKNNPKVLEIPFDAERKLMATVHQTQQHFTIYVKGAFETLAELCDRILTDKTILSFTNKKAWNKKVDELASKGLRTLAFAYKEVEKIPRKKSLTKNLVFLGIIGFLDPAREDVKATIDIYKKAGIKVVMVTGDHLKTAGKIALDVGLTTPNNSSDTALQGKELSITIKEGKTLNSKLLNTSVFARVTPRQKLDLITFHQKKGNIVGMIGDGINDVPALKKADIGIAMGIRGTEAAREVADVILKNDKFTAIELAIRQGRIVFQNIRQFVVYLLSCNLAEIISVGMAALLNLPSPLLPLQILFLNLVTDVFPALALGLGKGHGDIMKQPPRNPKEPIMTRRDWYATLFYGFSISASVLGIVVYAYFVMKLNWEIINNMAFYTLVLAQLFNVFNMPHHRESVLRNEVTKNIFVWVAIFLSLFITWIAYMIDPVAEALSLMELNMEQFSLTLVFAFGSFVLVQFIKHLKRVRI